MPYISQGPLRRARRRQAGAVRGLHGAIGKRAGAVGGLAAAVLLALAVAVQAADTGAAARSNRVPGVKPWARDDDAGGMALYALGACFEAYGHWSTYFRMVALSGSPFKVVYDTTEAYEPLRELFPVDVLKVAANAAGFPQARWLLDLPIDQVKEAVKDEIDKGHPVVAPFLKNDVYHGYVAIVGYDYDEGVFYVQGALRDTAYAKVPIPGQWSGPTASPVGWATNPVFVLGEMMTVRSEDPGQDKALLETGASLLRGGTLSYGLAAGEARYMAGAGPRQAAFGVPAYRLISWDVDRAPLVRAEGGQDEVNFGLIWRLDAQLGLLEHDRRYAAMALGYIVGRMKEGKHMEVQELTDNVERTGDEVRALRRIFWDQIPYAINTADGIAAYADSSGSIVFSIAGRDRLQKDLTDRGYGVFKTKWGPVMIADSRAKRLKAKLLVKSLETRESISMRMMEELAAYVGPDLGVEPQEPTGPARRRRK
jgi:hypothetical protein